MWGPARTLALALLALLTACGDLPQPYRGRPGREGSRLAVPLALRLAIPPPPQALLTDQGARQLADALAEALLAAEVPALATERPLPLDWQLDVRAEATNLAVTPRFLLLDADGKEQGATAARPVPVQQWANPTPEMFRAMAADAAPRLANLLLQVEAARKSVTPGALAAGPSRLRFTGVTGAPGDGNYSLTARMGEFLSRQGFVVQEIADGALFALDGKVSVVPSGRPGQQRVEILWKISRRDGEELGQVLQMNEIPNGALNRPWGDVAYVVAEEASGGVAQVVRNATTPPPAEATRAEPPPLPSGLPAPAGRPLAAPPSR